MICLIICLSAGYRGLAHDEFVPTIDSAFGPQLLVRTVAMMMLSSVDVLFCFRLVFELPQ